MKAWRIHSGGGSGGGAEVVQPAGDGHHQIGEAGLEVAEQVTHDSASFDACQRMFHHHPATRQGPVRRHGRRVQFPAARFFRRHDDRGSRWLPALEAAVAQNQCALGQNLNGGGHVLVMPSSGRGAGEELHPPALRHHHIFHGVPFLFAGVMPPVPPLVFGAANGAFRAVYHGTQFGTGRQQFRQLPGLAHGQRQLTAQSLFQDGGQPQHPAIGLRLGEAKTKSLDFLNRIVAEVKQDEEQAVGGDGEDGLGTRAPEPLAGLAGTGAPGMGVPRLDERLGQGGKLGRLQAGQGLQHLRLFQRAQHVHACSLLTTRALCLLRIESKERRCGQRSQNGDLRTPQFSFKKAAAYRRPRIRCDAESKCKRSP